MSGSLKNLNSGEVERLTVICLATCYGGETFYDFTDEQVAEYQRDPDGFAARYYGMTLEEYREWATPPWE
jgi:hypothetical protein